MVKIDEILNKKFIEDESKFIGMVNSRAGLYLAVQLQEVGLLDVELADQSCNSEIWPDWVKAGHYRRWLNHVLDSLKNQGTIIANGRGYRLAAPNSVAEARHQWIATCEAQASDVDKMESLRLITKCIDNIADVLRGQMQAELLLNSVVRADLALTILPGTRQFCDAVSTIACAHLVKNSNGVNGFKILHLGTGPDLVRIALEGRLSAVELAKVEFWQADNLDCAALIDEIKTDQIRLVAKPFDVSRAPQSQDIPLSYFDVVIASHALHRAPVLETAVGHIAQILGRNGLLIVHELTGRNLALDVTLGLLESWWTARDVGLRMAGSPTVTPENWEWLLNHAKFEGIKRPLPSAEACGQQIVCALALDHSLNLATSDTVTSNSIQGGAVETPHNTSSEQKNLVQTIISACVSEALKVKSSDISARTRFSDLGVDSILAARIIKFINSRLGTKLDVTVIFDHTTIERLAVHLVAAHEYNAEISIEPLDLTPIALSKPERKSKQSRAHEDASCNTMDTAIEVESIVPEDAIAIVGMSGQFPGAIDIEAFWDQLCGAACVVAPGSRWAWDAKDWGTADGFVGGFLDDVELFDAEFFAISDAEANIIDPQQRLFLEHSYLALEHAGYATPKLAGRSIGVYVGFTGSDYGFLTLDDHLPPQAMWGSAGSMLPARISYFFDLKGPAVAIDTACSSSLSAIKTGCSALRSGEVEMALVGGVYVQATDQFHRKALRAGMLSPSGRCSPFDHRADGMVPGEAVGCLVLKRLADALASRDSIYGLVIAEGSNQDGASNGITAPSAESQAALLRNLYSNRGIDPATIGMIEAHGTGTRLGDPIEVKALRQIFDGVGGKDYRCVLGSVKGNIGHATAAAGICSVIKAVKAMENQTIPPTANFDKISSYIDLEGSPFLISSTVQTWDHSLPTPRRCGVSNFGLSGTNVHLVLQEAPIEKKGASRLSQHLVLLSAQSTEQLKSLAWRLARHLETDSALAIGDVAYTLMVGRLPLEYRLGVVVGSTSEVVVAIDNWLADSEASDVGTAHVPEPNSALTQAGEEGAESELGVLGFENGKASSAEALRMGLVDLLSAFLAGANPDGEALYADDAVQRIALPAYPFAKRRYWVASLDKTQRRRPHHSILVPQEVSVTLPFDEPVGEGFGERWVVLVGEFPKRFDVALRRTGDTVVVIEIAGDSLAERYERAASKVFELLKRVLSRPDLGPTTVQIVLSTFDPILQSCLRSLGSLVLTAARENPILRSFLIDISDFGPNQSVGNLLRRIARFAPPGDYRTAGSKLYRTCYVEADDQVASSNQAPHWQMEGIYALFGGAGGLGRIVARDIAGSSDKSRILLIGRSKEHAEIRDFLDELRALGANAEYHSLDITNAAEVGLFFDDIAKRFGRLDGILHLAGETNDNFIIRKSEAEFCETLAPKVSGLTNIETESRKLKPELFLCFSSLSVLGNPGQADYAAGNAFMDHFMTACQGVADAEGRTSRYISINWPLWRDGGLKIGAAHLAVGAEDCAPPLGASEGVGLLHQCLNSTPLLPSFLIFDRAMELLQVATAESTSSYSLFESPSTVKGVAADILPQVSTSTLLPRVVQLFAKVSQIPEERLDSDRRFERYGIDSIMIATLNRELATPFPNVPKTLFFECETLRKVADRLLVLFPSEAAAWVGGGGEGRAAAADKSSDNTDDPSTKAVAGRAKQQRPNRDGAMAIIGLAGQYPKAPNIDVFWRNLSEGRDCITQVPPDRWSLDDFYESDPNRAVRSGKSYCKSGGFLEGFADFDSSFFGLAPKEMRNIDPQERLFLTTCWEAIEDAGYTPAGLGEQCDGAVGVYAGITKNGFDLYGPELWLGGSREFPRTSFASVANRVSYLFDFRGPSIPVDTMCSASLSAIHMACSAIRAGECDIALAGGVNLYLHPSSYVALSGLYMLSPTGRCRSFGEGGDGFVPGEGVGAVVIRPLDQAIAGGDHIHAIIKASKINHGGRTHGYTVPNPKAQAQVIAQTLADGGIDPSTIGYVEAHGTGTELGDPIEVAGLTLGFALASRIVDDESGQDRASAAPHQCYLGSVKSNIGHLEAAAGIAGLTKLVLQMRHRSIAPSLHAERLNPNVDFDAGAFKVATTLTDWRPQLTHSFGFAQEQPLRASLSSFGAGGANAHLVLEEYIPDHLPAGRISVPTPFAIILSARSDEQLAKQFDRLAQAIAQPQFTDDDIERIAFTLQTGRRSMLRRWGAIAATKADLLAVLGAGWPDASHRQMANPHAWAGTDQDVKLRSWLRGEDVNWSDYWRGHQQVRRIALPTYHFKKERLWIRDLLKKSSKITTRQDSMLVSVISSDPDSAEFEITLDPEAGFVCDHRVQNHPVFAGVGQLEILRRAGCLIAPETGLFTVRNLVWRTPVTPDSSCCDYRLVFEARGEGAFAFRILDHAKVISPKVYSQGVIESNVRSAPPMLDLSEIRRRCSQSVGDITNIYQLLRDRGLDYGPQMRAMTALHTTPSNAAMAEVLVQLAAPLDNADESFAIAPAFVDGALQAGIGFLLRADGDEATFSTSALPIPFSAAACSIYGPTPATGWAHLILREVPDSNGGSWRIDADICDDEGKLCVAIRDYVARQLGSPRNGIDKTARGVGKSLIGDDIRNADDPILCQIGWQQIGSEKNSRSFFALDELVHVLFIDCDRKPLSRRKLQTLLPETRVSTISLPDALPIDVYRHAVMQIKYLSRDLVLKSHEEKIRLCVVLRTADKSVSPVSLAGISAFLHSVHAEYSGFSGQCVDIAGEIDRSDLRDLLVDRILPAPDRTLRWKEGRLEAQVLEEVALPSEALPAWRDGEVYLVTGGAGALSSLAARDIALWAPDARIILCGRRSWDSVDLQAVMGGRVPPGLEYRSVDLSRRDEVRDLIADLMSRYGRLDGVLHSAGVLRDAPLQFSSDVDTKAVFDPKIVAVSHLDEETKTVPLRFFVVYSSLAGVFGSPFQFDYAAAGGYLDDFARSRALKAKLGRRSGTTLSFDWPFWANGGMTVSPMVLARMRQSGLEPLADNQGMQQLHRALASVDVSSSLIVLPGDKARIRSILPDALKFAPVTAEIVATHRSLERAEPTEIVSGSQPELGKIDVSVGLMELLRKAVSSVSGVNLTEIDPDTDLSDYGFDSIALTNLANELNEALKLELPPTLFFEHNNIAELAVYLCERFGSQIDDRVAAVFDISSVGDDAMFVDADPRHESLSKAPIPKIAATSSAIEATRDARISPTRFAIIGMAVRFPGADSADQFWENLEQGRDCISEVPLERWDWRKHFGDPLLESGKSNAKWGGFISGIDQFDPFFFGISPREANLMDPQQRLSLQMAWHAIEDSGYAPSSLAGSMTGVYLATTQCGYSNLISLAGVAPEGFMGPGNAPSMCANRLSYLLDLHGPSEPVETACSSALVAMHRAMAGMRSGECDQAIVGAVNTLVLFDLHASFNKAGMLSPSGRCRTFSAEADGYVRGEGVAFFLVKPLAAAEAAGDSIYGVILGSAVNHGGKANSLTAPNTKAQAAVIRAAFENAEIDVASVNYVEAHGTGTPLGDPVEIDALKMVLDSCGGAPTPGPECWIGSVKSNIGHLELAAGAAGIAKVLLQFKHDAIVPTLHAKAINPYIDLAESRLSICDRKRRWTRQFDQTGKAIPRRAGISSFGFGGVNAHILIEDYEDRRVDVERRHLPHLLLSGKSQNVLRTMAIRLAEALEEGHLTDRDLLATAYTLQVGRDHFEHRLALSCESAVTAAEVLRRFGDSSGDEIPSSAVSTASAYRLAVRDPRSGRISRLLSGELAGGEEDADLEHWLDGKGVKWIEHWTQQPVPKRLRLPKYPFEESRHWVSEANDQALHRAEPSAVLTVCRSEDFDRFEVGIPAGSSLYVDHMVGDRAILPAAAYLLIARQVAEQIYPAQSSWRIEKMVFESPCFLDASPEASQLFIWLVEDQGGFGCHLYQASSPDLKRATWILVAGRPEQRAQVSIDNLRQTHSFNPISIDELYEGLAHQGLRYGPSHQRLAAVALDDPQAPTSLFVTFRDSITFAEEDDGLSPGIVDGAFQSLAVLSRDHEMTERRLPRGLAMADVSATSLKIRFAQVSLPAQGHPEEGVNIDLLSEDGAIVVAICGYATRQLGRSGQDDLAARPIAHVRGAEPVSTSTLATGSDLIPDIHENDQEGAILAQADVVELVKAMLSPILAVAAADLDPDAELERYGIDSVLSLEFVAKLEEIVGVVEKTLLFEYRTISRVAKYLCENHSTRIAHNVLGAEVPSQGPLSGLERPANVTWERPNNDPLKPLDLEPMAIVGMAGRFPQANSIDAFWDNLIAGVDCITEIPPSRWNHGATAARLTVNPDQISRWGGFCDDVDCFDALFFNISPREAEAIDPQERLFLQCAYETLANAGYCPSGIAKPGRDEGLGAPVGVFVGVMYEEYQLYGAQAQARGHAIALSGHPASIANRVSYTFDFCGPSMAIDTMCSSSITAIQLACESIRLRRCASALAGGVNLSLHPNKYLALSQGGFTSSTGRCRSFGADGDGYVPGEAVGAVYIKPLRDALADRDHVYAVIRGTAINHGGKTNGYTVPNPQAQSDVIFQAIRQAGVDPNAISYLEAHGTGTALGDPIEISALRKAFEKANPGSVRDRPCAIGSVKSNIGHCESAAGIAAVVKVLLQMKHRVLVPSLHADNANPNIEFSNTPFRVQQACENWLPVKIHQTDGFVDGGRIAGISSFGAGGSNAHLILEEFLAEPYVAARGQAFVIPLSAKSGEQLHQLAGDLLAKIQRERWSDEHLPSIAFTLQEGRDAFEHRWACRAETMDGLCLALADLANQSRNSVLATDQPYQIVHGRARRNDRMVAYIQSDPDLSRRVAEWAAGNQLLKIMQLWVDGVGFSWRAVTPAGITPQRIPLPGYPFRKVRHWFDGMLPEIAAHEFMPAATADQFGHPLVHENVSDQFGLRFKGKFTGREPAVRDHSYRSVPLLSAAAQVEMALAAMSRVFRSHKSYALRGLEWQKPIAIENSDAGSEVFVAILPSGVTTASIEIAQNEGENQVICCVGAGVVSEARSEDYLGPLIEDIDSASLSAPFDLDILYDAFSAAGLQYGPSYRVIRRLRRTEVEGKAAVIADLVLPPEDLSRNANCIVPPALLDGAFQACAGFMLEPGNGVEPGRSLLPVSLEHLRVFGSLTGRCTALVLQQGNPTGPDMLKLSVTLFSEAGVACVEASGLVLRAPSRVSSSSRIGSLNRNERVPTNSVPAVLGSQTHLFLPSWQVAPLAEADARIEAVPRLIYLVGDTKLDAADWGAGVFVIHLKSDPSSIADCYGEAAAKVFADIKSRCTESGPSSWTVQIVNVPSQADPTDSVLAEGLAAMLRTAQLELPRWRFQSISFDSAIPVDARIRILGAEARQGAGGTVQYTNAGIAPLREVRSIEHSISLHADAIQAFAKFNRRDGVYLITGGLGGLGLIFAREIACSAVSPRIILTGRSELDEAAIGHLAELELAGAQANYRQLDVSNADAVHACIDDIVREYGEISAVLHAAGIIRDRLIVNKSIDDFDSVLSAKVQGIVNIDLATRHLLLDYFIVFSSVTAILGNVGQIDYAAANGFVDGYVRARVRRVANGAANGRSIALNWPLWKDGGMQVSTSVEAGLKTVGLETLVTHEGIAAFYAMLGSGAAQVGVLAGNPTFLDTVQSYTAAESSVQAKGSMSEADVADKNLDSAVLIHLSRAISTLMKIPLDEVDVEAEFGEYGFDSITITTLANQLASEFNVELTGTEFFEHSTPAKLAEYLCKSYPSALNRVLVERKPSTSNWPTGVARHSRPAALHSQIDGERSTAEAFGESTTLKAFANVSQVAPSQVSRSAAPDHTDRYVRQRTQEPVAVIGMSGEFPGASNLQVFWENLISGQDSIGLIPEDRWDWKAIYGDPETEQNKTNVKWGGFIADVAAFDPLFFSISPKEAAMMDPQQRLFVTHAWLAIEDAGIAPASLSETKTAIFVGTGNSGYSSLLKDAGVPIEGYTAVGMSPSVGPNRVSFLLNLHGASEPVETACSSALVAIHRAVRSLHDGDSDLVIAGGVNTLVIPDMHISFSKAGMLAPDGRCKTFSDRADGYGRGEGVGVVVLKRLSDAVRDGDPIYAQVIGSAENHGGRATSLTAPNPRAQAAVIRSACVNAGIDPRTLTYIEAHGTGTPLGDPIEVDALKRVFATDGGEDKSWAGPYSEAFCGLGSVKSNIGHLELAAGVAGFIKTVLQLKHRKLAPTLHADNLNPRLKLEGSPFYIVRSPQQWGGESLKSGEEVLRAGVSSFGFGGVNAHVLLESFTAQKGDTSVKHSKWPIVLSAQSWEAMSDKILDLRAYFGSGGFDHSTLSGISRTLSEGRNAMAVRLGFVADSVAEAETLLAHATGLTESSGTLVLGEIGYTKTGLKTFDLAPERLEYLQGACRRHDYGELLEEWCRGANVPWSELLFADVSPRKRNLPGYPLRRDRYWIDPKNSGGEITGQSGRHLNAHGELRSILNDLREGRSDAAAALQKATQLVAELGDPRS